jgi:hypothetical protein
MYLSNHFSKTSPIKNPVPLVAHIWSPPGLPFRPCPESWNPPWLMYSFQIKDRELKDLDSWRWERLIDMIGEMKVIDRN